MIFNFFNKNKEISIDLREERGLSRGIGLMFRTRNTKNLLFVFDKPSRVAITAWFVFFPFWAVWLNEKKKVMEVKKIFPFQFSIKPKKDAKYLIEIPINETTTHISSLHTENE